MNGDDDYSSSPGPYQLSLIDNLRRAPTLSAPTQGTPRPGTSPTTRQQYKEALTNYQAQVEQRPDTSERERIARGQYEAAGEDIGPAILLQALGGKLAPWGGQVLQRSLAARGPQKVTGGEYIGGQFVEDPYAAQERRLKGQGLAVSSLRQAAEDEEQQAARVATGERQAAHERRMEQQFGLTLAETRARRAEANAARGTKQEPLVPVYDPETQQTTYAPRSQAVGQQLPPKVKAGYAGPKMPGEVGRMNLATGSLGKTLDEYEGVLKTFGPRTFDQLNPSDRAKITSVVNRARLEAKEAFGLGALTGPDVAVLDAILADPSSWRGALYGKEGLSEQLQSARRAVQIRRDAIREQYGDATTAPGAAQQKPDVSRETRKTIGGKSYVKRDGKWFEESSGD